MFDMEFGTYSYYGKRKLDLTPEEIQTEIDSKLFLIMRGIDLILNEDIESCEKRTDSKCNNYCSNRERIQEYIRKGLTLIFNAATGSFTEEGNKKLIESVHEIQELAKKYTQVMKDVVNGTAEVGIQLALEEEMMQKRLALNTYFNETIKKYHYQINKVIKIVLRILFCPIYYMWENEREVYIPERFWNEPLGQAISAIRAGWYDSPFISVNEAASIIGVTRQTVHNLVTTGQIRSARVGGLYIMRLYDVLDYVEMRRKKKSSK